MEKWDVWLLNNFIVNMIDTLFIEVAVDFKLHLADPQNKRIMFSGRFGKGKTTFLQEFFSNQEKYLGEEKYRYIYLDPVHYSIASNEDIFRYIKYDILLSLTSLDIKFDDIEFSAKETASYYIWKHPEEAIKPVIEFIPKVGKTISTTLFKLGELYSKIKSFQGEVNAKPEAAQILKFLDDIHVDPKSLYESDTITHIIQSLLIKGKVDGNENILIIDNLDRIDPEHIFRILNVFSAHMDFHKTSGSENKFGFDKILLVCDLQNLRNIFKNRYGKDVDFNGYVNKFYTNDVFYYQNYKQIGAVVKNLAFNVVVKVEGYKEENKLGVYFSHNDFGIAGILSALVIKNLLTLRQVVNATSSALVFRDRSVYFKDYEVDIFSVSPLLQIKFLAKVLGGYYHFYESITSLLLDNYPLPNFDNLFLKLLYFDTKPLHMSNTNGKFHTTIGRSDIIYQIKLDSLRRNIEEVQEVSTSTNPNPAPFKPKPKDFYDLYLKVIEDAFKEKIIE